MKNDTLIIGYDECKKDVPFIVIGRSTLNSKAIDIINMYSGEEAKELYNQLISHTNKEEK